MAEPATSTDAALEKRIAAAVANLDANSRDKRSAAENELLKIGPDALPHLPAPELLQSPSAREAVRRIRVQLERRKALASVEASRVTLSAAAPLADVIAAIQSQTGNRLDASRLPPKTLQQRVSVEYAEQEYWPVLDDLARRAKLRYEMGTGAIELFAADGDSEDEIAHAYAGAFRVDVLSAELRPLVGDDGHRLLRILFTALAEPRLRPLFVKFTPGDLSGRSKTVRLQPYNPKANYELPLGEGGSRVRMQADMLVPASTKLDTVAFSGTLSTKVAAGEERIAFGPLDRASGMERRRGGVTVRLNAVAPEGAAASAGLRVRAVISYDAGGPAFESHRTWIFHNRAFLETEAGEKTQPSDFKTVQQSGGAVAVDYKFPPLNQPLAQYRFVYVAPTLIVEVPVRFEFEDVPVTEQNAEAR